MKTHWFFDMLKNQKQTFFYFQKFQQKKKKEQTVIDK
jgi:hypothetical protein